MMNKGETDKNETFNSQKLYYQFRRLENSMKQVNRSLRNNTLDTFLEDKEGAFEVPDIVEDLIRNNLNFNHHICKYNPNVFLVSFRSDN